MFAQDLAACDLDAGDATRGRDDAEGDGEKLGAVLGFDGSAILRDVEGVRRIIHAQDCFQILIADLKEVALFKLIERFKSADVLVGFRDFFGGKIGGHHDHRDNGQEEQHRLAQPIPAQ